MQRAKMVDAKGRLTLGPRFAGRAVIIHEQSDTSLVVELARTIPEREAWLYDNPEALASVRSGLAQAKEGKLRQIDLDAALAIADQCDDE